MISKTRKLKGLQMFLFSLKIMIVLKKSIVTGIMASYSYVRVKGKSGYLLPENIRLILCESSVTKNSIMPNNRCTKPFCLKYRSVVESQLYCSLLITTFFFKDRETRNYYLLGQSINSGEEKQQILSFCYYSFFRAPHIY